jgi:hypothetical protein
MLVQVLEVEVLVYCQWVVVFIIVIVQLVFYVHLSFLDSPSTTSATTYKIQAKQSAGATTYVGSNNNDADSSSSLRAASVITVYEIAG